MAIQAQLANGTVLSFPDGTAQDVVDKAVREHVASDTTDPVVQAAAQNGPVQSIPATPVPAPNVLDAVVEGYQQGGGPSLTPANLPAPNEQARSEQDIGQGLPGLYDVVKAGIASLPAAASALGYGADRMLGGTPNQAMSAGVNTAELANIAGLVAGGEGPQPIGPKLQTMYEHGASAEELQAAATASGHALPPDQLAVAIKSRERGGTANFVDPAPPVSPAESTPPSTGGEVPPGPSPAPTAAPSPMEGVSTLPSPVQASSPKSIDMANEDEGESIEGPSGIEGDTGRPKYVGNINVDRLGPPEETDQHLANAVEGANLDPQSHEDTINQAGTLLKSKSPLEILTMDPKQSELPAHGLAVRTILNASTQKVADLADLLLDPSTNTTEVNEAFDKWAMINGTAGQVASGNAKTAGRYLNSFGIRVGDTDTNLSQAVSAMSAEVDPATRDALAQKISELRNNPDAVQQVTQQLGKPYWEDYVLKTWYNFALSNPKTWVNTALDNAQQLGTKLGELKVAVSPEEFSARTAAFNQGLKDAGTLFTNSRDPLAQSIADAYSSGHPGTGASRVPIQGVNLGPVLEWTSFGPKTISAIDQFYRGLGANMETAGLAVRKAQAEGLTGQDLADRVTKLRASPTKDMVTAANEAARSSVYADKLSGPFSGAISKATAQRPGMTIPERLLRVATTMIIPFPRVAYNIAKNIVSSSPLGLVVGENAKAIAAGGVAKNIALARISIGTGVLSSMALLASQGVLTPKGLKIGDSYYSLGNTQLGTTAQLVANVYDAWQKGGMSPQSLASRMAALAGTTANDISENTWFGDTAKFFQLFEKGAEGDYARDNFVREHAASVVPAGVSAVNRSLIDPNKRAVNSASDAIQARVPGLSQALPLRFDPLGNPMRIDQNLLTGTSVTPVNPIQNEVDRLTATKPDGNGYSIVPSAPKTLKDTYTGEKVKLTPQEQQDFNRLSGGVLSGAMRSIMANPAYHAATDDQRREAIKEVLKVAHENARDQVLAGRGGK